MKKMICIVCPNSCELKISEEGEQIAVSGNMCPKGIDFAVAELTNPMRTISSTVKTSFPGFQYCRSRCRERYRRAAYLM